MVEDFFQHAEQQGTSLNQSASVELEDIPSHWGHIISRLSIYHDTLYMLYVKDLFDEGSHCEDSPRFA